MVMDADDRAARRARHQSIDRSNTVERPPWRVCVDCHQLWGEHGCDAAVAFAALAAAEHALLAVQAAHSECPVAYGETVAALDAAEARADRLAAALGRIIGRYAAAAAFPTVMSQLETEMADAARAALTEEEEATDDG